MRHSKIDAILDLIDGALAGYSFDNAGTVPVGTAARREPRPVRPGRVTSDPR